jgi:hypothetical protein
VVAGGNRLEDLEAGRVGQRFGYFLNLRPVHGLIQVYTTQNQALPRRRGVTRRKAFGMENQPQKQYPGH